MYFNTKLNLSPRKNVLKITALACSATKLISTKLVSYNSNVIEQVMYMVKCCSKNDPSKNGNHVKFELRIQEQM